MITDILTLIWFCNFSPTELAVKDTRFNDCDYVYLPRIVNIVIVEPM